jgi:Zn-finger nucleic acid-binding protein
VTRRICPYCQIELTDHERQGATPKPDDVGLCFHCGGVSIFTEDGMRLPTPDELAEIESEEEFRSAQEAMRRTLNPYTADRIRKLHP